MKRSARAISVPIHTWVICYDIRLPRTRRRVAKLLESRGDRVQYSVFECRLGNTAMRRLRSEIQLLIDPEKDRVRWYPLCIDCGRRKRRHGAKASFGHPTASSALIV